MSVSYLISMTGLNDSIETNDMSKTASSSLCPFAGLGLGLVQWVSRTPGSGRVSFPICLICVSTPYLHITQSVWLYFELSAFVYPQIRLQLPKFGVFVPLSLGL